MNSAFKFEIKPNRANRIALAKHAGTARFAYNWGLAERKKLYETEKKSTSAFTQSKELNAVKKTLFPWMSEVSKCAPQEALRDLDVAFKNFFRGIKTGKKVGFPRFKKKGDRDSFRLYGTFPIKGTTVRLPRLGVLRLKEDPCKLVGRILSATVSRQADRWFVSFCVERHMPVPVPIVGPIVGIDLGLKSFAVLSDGTSFLAPKPLARNLKLLKRRSRQHSKKKKGSANRKKSALCLARLHRRIRNVRQDSLHKLTTNLAKTKSEIVIEDLCVKGMIRNGKLSRAIADVGWGEFRRQLDYKTKWYGSTLTVAPRNFPSTQLCSTCGGRNSSKLTLADRSWTCESCGTSHDRDLNAAKNLLSLRSTGRSPGIDACGLPSKTEDETTHVV